MRFKLKNNEITTTDEEKAEILKNHFHDVFNSKIDIDWSIINELLQKEMCQDIGSPLNFQEFNVAIKKLTLHKATGLNGVSPNAIKALDDDNKLILFRLCAEYFDNTVDIEEWLMGSLKILPKKGDLMNPNNWRGIILLDISSKVVSLVVTARLQKALERYRIPNQFGSTPKTGCLDGSFYIKSILQMINEYDLNTWVVFVDLVKAFDTIHHELLFKLLGKYAYQST